MQTLRTYLLRNINFHPLKTCHFEKSSFVHFPRRFTMSSSVRPPRVFVTSSSVPPSSVEFLRTRNFEVDQWDKDGIIPRDELMKRVKDIDALYCTLNDKIDGEIVEAAGENLKVVGTMSVGTDHVDISYLKKRKIKVGYTPEVLTDACAEFVVLLILSTLRRAIEAAMIARNGEWPVGWGPTWMCGGMILGSKVGFIGMGRIGQAVAKRLAPFEPSELLYFDVARKESLESELGLTWRQNLDDLLSEADVVITLCSLSESTRNLMSKEKLSLMKRGSYFFNPSRGDLVDQDALVELLRQGHFAGVGLDVTVPEPLPPSHPLYSFRECVIFPHIASASIQTREKMGDLTVKNILAALHGKEMPAEWK